MARTTRNLYVFLHGEVVGRLVPLRRGAVHLYYEANLPMSASPLSLSLPFGLRERHDVASWVDGLLPENPRTRSRWARELGADSTNPYDLLCTQAGLECAGAVQFYPQPVLPDPRMGTLVQLSESDLANMLRLISQDAEGDPAEGLGDLRLSLPGAQPKMALRLTDDEWHLSTGSLATTHILKPQSGHLNPALRNSIAVNEHLCQTAAATLGLDAARTSLEAFEDEQCLVVERFDRNPHKGEVRRTHFEDLCQALGVPGNQKYQSNGGPTPEAIIGLLSRESREDPRKFFLSLFYNWLIGNPDGHSKNYGLLFDGPRTRLAPLYDLNSLAPYLPHESEAMRSAMRFEGRNPTTVDEWSQTAAHVGIDIAPSELREMREALPQALDDAAAQCPEWAAEAACRICEDVTAHAGRTVPGITGEAALPLAPELANAGICNKTVKRTGKPCLLRPGHRGICRSVS